MFRKKHFLLLSMLFLLLVSGCSIQKESAGDKPFEIQLTVSRDFSSEILFTKGIQTQPGETVLDVLEKNLEVETSSGGFIDAIKGLKSAVEGETGKDWFFYINGIAANCSAKAYHLKPGDKVVWDYHPWNGNSFIPAIIGSYPEPFINGFEGKTKGTRIFYSEDSRDEALKIKQSLAEMNAKNVVEVQLPQNFEILSDYPSIIIGEYENLIKNKNIAKLLSDGNQRGVFARFDKKRTEILDYSGLVKKAGSPSIGVIFATASSLGDTAPVWIVTSLEHKGIEDITNLICSNPESIKNYYGVAYNEGKIERLPCR